MIQTHLDYTCSAPTPLLMQIEAADDGTQVSRNTSLEVSPATQSRKIDGEHGFGLRRWLTVSDTFRVDYRAEVEITRPGTDLRSLDALPVDACPDELTTFLLPSRYCQPDRFANVIAQKFEGLSGGTLIASVRDWVAAHFTYDGAASTGETTAIDSFEARRGVCRDYAHVVISVARAAGIPARYASGYAPDVSPQDFHAVAEVYLSGAWHIVDATDMSTSQDFARIGIGRDAADVAFLTAYGPIVLQKQTVAVDRVK